MQYSDTPSRSKKPEILGISYDFYHLCCDFNDAMYSATIPEKFSVVRIVFPSGVWGVANIGEKIYHGNVRLTNPEVGVSMKIVADNSTS